MIYDILEVFEKLYEDKADELILGSYSLKDGLYVKINKDGTLEFYEAKTVKKEKVFNSLDGISNSEIQEWFKQRDYWSNVVETAKSYDVPIKSIHNNNYLTLFMKADKFMDVKIEHIKSKLFLTVLNFKKFTNKNDKEIICAYDDIINVLSRKKDIVKKYQFIKKELENLKQKVKDLDIKNYIKIFFEEDLDIYKKESEIYLSLKIFNKNKYNKKIENKIYGLSNSNMGLNIDKPFLENKTRKNSIPFLIENKNALLLKKFFDWLKVQPSYEYKAFNKKYFIQKQLNKTSFETEITDFDYIPIKIDDINKQFKPIYIKNYLKITDKNKNLLENYVIRELWQLEKDIDCIFYNRRLIFNYYKDSKEIKVSDKLSKNLRGILLSTRYQMNNFFRKYYEDEKSFYNHIEKYGRDFIFEYLKETDEKKIYFAKQKAKEALNLKLSLKKHYKGVEMDIEGELKNIRTLLTQESYPMLSKDEFLFLSGQWAYYLLSQSRADSKNKTFSFAEKYFKAKDIQKIQDILKVDLEKYKHAINLNNSKAKKAIALIKAYDKNEKLSGDDKDRFLVGFTVENVFYDKKKEEEN